MVGLVRVVRSKKDEQEAYELLYKAYGPSYFHAKEVFDVTRIYDSTLNKKNLFILKEGDSLVGAVRTVTRRLMVFGQEFSVGGIAAIVVEPRYRRGGAVFHSMTQSVLSEMSNRGLDFCLIFARRAVDHFFVRHGFWGTPVEKNIRLLNPPHPQATSIQFRCIKDSDVPFLERMHRSINQYFSVFLERPKELWMSKIKNSSFTARFDAYLCIDTFTSLPVGYVVAEPAGTIIEAALLPDYKLWYPSVFFSQSSPVFEAALRGLSLPQEHPALRMLRGHAYSSFTRHPHYGGNLLKILNPTDHDSPLMECVRRQLAQRGVIINERLLRGVTPQSVSRVLTAALFGYEVQETRMVLEIPEDSPWERMIPVDVLFSALDDF
ncbi:GNAT family N-acetyltransferase [Candidatus Uhrbacteria bacterium]|nr:GNAT family N-acetyltransferase [Candidatus Uhrbacteria bacterium]